MLRASSKGCRKPTMQDARERAATRQRNCWLSWSPSFFLIHHRSCRDVRNRYWACKNPSTLVAFGEAEVVCSSQAGAMLQAELQGFGDSFHCALPKDRLRETPSQRQLEDSLQLQQPSVSFKNQILDAEREISQNTSVWLPLCELDFFLLLLLHMLFQTYSLLSTGTLRMHLWKVSSCSQWIVPAFQKQHWKVHPQRQKSSSLKHVKQTVLK